MMSLFMMRCGRRVSGGWHAHYKDGNARAEGHQCSQLSRGFHPLAAACAMQQTDALVMGMAVTSDLAAAYTVSADHLLMKHNLLRPSTPSESPSTSLRSIGHSSLAISANNAILAVGGWDGAIRLFSAQSLKSLGTLKYHREGVQTLAFAPAPSTSSEPDRRDTASTIDLDFVSDSASAPTSLAEDSDSGSDTETEGQGGRQVARRGDRGEVPRGRWLVSGSKDRRLAIWGLMDFGS